jgi:hypothetical protein
MRRRDFITLVGRAVAAWPFATRAQQPMPVIGFLTPAGGEASISQLLAAFRRGLASSRDRYLFTSNTLLAASITATSECAMQYCTRSAPVFARRRCR